MMPVLLIGLLYLVFSAHIATGTEPVWQGSKVEAENKVQNLLGQLKTKSDDTKAANLRSGERFDSYVKGLGFDSLSDLQNSTLGTPIPVYIIHLDTLRGIAAGPVAGPLKPWSLLEDTGDAIAPILVQGKVRSSVKVYVTTGPNPGVELGPLGSVDDTNLLKEIEQKPCKCFIIRARALNQDFLAEGDNANSSFKLRTMDDLPGRWQKGQVLDAKKLFEELSAEAQHSRYDMRGGH